MFEVITEHQQQKCLTSTNNIHLMTHNQYSKNSFVNKQPTHQRPVSLLPEITSRANLLLLVIKTRNKKAVELLAVNQTTRCVTCNAVLQPSLLKK